MAEMVKRDENILTEKEKGVLDRTLKKLEQFFPEHKVFALDALCPQQRESSAKLAKKLGYPSTADFLSGYGFETIKGPKVYEIRKNCGIKPGEEPELIKERIDNAINSLSEYYPDHLIEGSFNRTHSQLFSKLTGFYQWLGYKSMEDMLSAYGFSYTAKSGRKKSVDPEAIIAELKARYPDGIEMTASEIKAANPDLKIKSLMNDSKNLFGMTFADYLLEQGIIRKHVKTAEEIEEEKAIQKERNAEKEYQRALIDLSKYEEYCQIKSLGWNVLPSTAEQLFKENYYYKTSRRMDFIMQRFEIDPELHFRKFGVLATEKTDNILRELIQYINFNSIIEDTGLVVCSTDQKNIEMPEHSGENFVRNEINPILPTDDDSEKERPGKDIINKDIINNDEIEIFGRRIDSDVETWINGLEITPAQKEYLFAIANISKTAPVVRAIDICNMLGKSKASVSVALGKLRDLGYIKNDKGWISLNIDD